MHVLHFITGLDNRDGGPSAAIVGLATAQCHLGARVSLVATYRPDDDNQARVKQLQHAGVSLTLLGPTRDPFQRVPGMKQACRDAINGSNRPDIIHIHNTWENLQHFAARAAHTAGTPYVFRPCGMLDPWSLKQSPWKKRAMLALRVRTDLNQAAAIHYSTETERNGAISLRLTASTIVEPNGVTLEHKTRFSRNDLRQKYNLDQGPILLFLGRLHPQKGLYILANAFHQVLQNWPDHRPRPTLLLAGPDEANTRAPLTDHLKTLGIHNSVVFTGPLAGNDKLMALQGSDLFCLPSYLESFGISVAEALVAGTPALISDQVGIVHEIEQAGVGASSPVDPQAYAQLLQTWLFDDNLRTTAAQRAGPWAKKTYNWHTIAQSWVQNHYPSIIQKNRSAV